MKKKKYRDPNAPGICSEIIINVIIMLFSLACVIPFIFITIISLTEEKSLMANGYSFLPAEWSIEAFKYIFSGNGMIINSFMISVILVLVGTILGVTFSSMYAYTLFRKDYAFRKFFVWLSFITMIFSAGLVPTYVVMTQFFRLKDNIWSLILPLLCSPFNIIILRTFYSTSVPEALIESAKIDGSNEFRTFFKIIAPISLPGIATIALFYTLGYWNDWFNAMLYIDSLNKVPLQAFLMRIQSSLDLLKNSTGGVEALEQMQNMPSESARMALVVIIVVPIAFAYPFFQKYFVSGLTVGAVKG